MVAIGKFLNQTVSLQRKGVSDPYYPGDITYNAPVGIKGRYVPASGLVRTATGDEIDSKGKLLTEEIVGLGDLIEGTEAKGVEAIVDKRGKTLGFRVYL